MKSPIGRDSDKFILRLPPGMRDKIKFAADTNKRSMNAEVVALLEDKYPDEIEISPEGAKQIMDLLSAQVSQCIKAGRPLSSVLAPEIMMATVATVAMDPRFSQHHVRPRTDD